MKRSDFVSGLMAKITFSKAVLPARRVSSRMDGNSQRRCQKQVSDSDVLLLLLLPLLGE